MALWFITIATTARINHIRLTQYKVVNAISIVKTAIGSKQSTSSSNSVGMTSSISCYTAKLFRMSQISCR